MAEGEVMTKANRKRTPRSPGYPYMAVDRALAQTKALLDKEGEYAAPLEAAMAAWGYSPKSSGGRQTLSTLRYYGLISVTGEGDKRMVRVSEIARRILLDEREDDTEKRALIREVAAAPTAHQRLLEKYPNGLASDQTVRHFLTFDLGFNRDAASEMLAEFKETAEFAGLYQPHKVVDNSDGTGDSERADPPSHSVCVGDRVQWTSDGVDQFAQGAEVLAISDNGDWIFTDQGTAGIPTKEVRIMERVLEAQPPEAPPHVLAALQAKQARGADEAAPSGSRKAVFPVSDGDVTLVFPDGMTTDALEELGAYLDIFLKRERKAKEAAERVA